MAAYRYSIARYVPDPVRDERLNIGVVLAKDDPPYFGSMFLGRSQTARVKRLAGTAEVGFIFDLADELGSRPQERLFDQGAWTLSTLEEAVVDWANTVQFSPLRGATGDDPEVLLARLFARYVAKPQPTQRRSRGRRWVQAAVRQTLTKSLNEVRPDIDPAGVIEAPVQVEGEYDTHVLDFALVNGARRGYVHTLSFEIHDDATIKGEVDRLKWTIDDLRQAPGPRLPVTVVAIGAGQRLDDATRVYERLDAQVVIESQLDGWATKTAHELAELLH